MAYYNDNSLFPNRPSMYSSPPQAAPPPPQRPYFTVYQPSSSEFVQPPPPPRPSSAYIAPFPGQKYDDQPTYNPPYPPPPSDTIPQRYSSLTPQPLHQPQPVSLVSPPEVLPPRSSSLSEVSENTNSAGGYYGNAQYQDSNTPVYPPPTPAETPFPTQQYANSAASDFGQGHTGTQPFVPLRSHTPSLASSFSSLAIDTSPQMQHQAFPSSSSSSLSSASSATEPPRVVTFPTLETLQNAATTLDTAEDIDQISWAQDVLRLVDKQLSPGGGGPPTDFTHPDAAVPNINKLSPALKDMVDNAVSIIIVVSTSPNQKASALALYLKAKLQSSGLCQDTLPKNNRQAFKDFESAARGGEIRGWYRLGMDYEGVNDIKRAKGCYERGIKRGDCECTYRMGMAHLLGQLNLPANPATALSLLRQASDISTIDFPQPSYVYGMLLAGELSVPTDIPASLVIPPTATPTEALYNQWNLARDAIERAAYFSYPPAQYKAGFLYEHAALGTAYDPLVSVNWYTYASKNGEKEADMALSKWFLCGAEGNFPKNESLARTFAEKAARKGHPNGCFALGYYYELGVGGRKDLDQAKKWYKKAANLGNADAPIRLSALSAPVPTSISMAEHETRLNDTLVRRRTQAKIRSDRQSISRPNRRHGQNPPPPPQATLQMPQAFTSPRPQEWEQRRPTPSQRPVPVPMPMAMPVPSASPSPMSPRVQAGVGVGEIMSPNVNDYYGNPIPSSNSFPSRPPIPHQSFNQNQTYPDNNARRQQGYRPDENGRKPSGVSVSTTSTSLSDLPLPEEGKDGNRPPKKEAATFAEMGFQSKPVEEDGCVIM
ncbi:uncharacterized protein I303_103978 [Kwoniella dejecticola CBS 10117]|uniref:Chitin synthase regulator 3 n=1 Tax=Kwoniella dejecticola CBS 10117 TaxID=1296121 RepID=A0A1A6A895_9TREE|nr:uncharacterized protein I303_03995 [Kwoniella dejecticola CBS 10117]OBR86273.1 hypothetical protein I303_03995 [Kwoniella dejecticola CBS 10117]